MVQWNKPNCLKFLGNMTYILQLFFLSLVRSQSPYTNGPPLPGSFIRWGACPVQNFDRPLWPQFLRHNTHLFFECVHSNCMQFVGMLSSF